MGYLFYKNRVNEVYKEFYCNANGSCKYYEECKEGISQPPKFTFDRANIGIEYGESDIPKIAVVGLEALGKSGIIQDISQPSESKYNPHYKGVRYVLAYILSKIAGKDLPQGALKCDLKNYNDYMRQYTLLEFYKCAFGSEANGLPHTEAMKKHCQEILLKEIQQLDLDFLVVQVKANRPYEFHDKLVQLYDACELLEGDEYTGAYKLWNKKQELLLIYSYHGSSDPNRVIRAWTNDRKNGFKYINEYLNSVLDKAVEVYMNRQRKR